MKGLVGKRAVVTGGSSGIGQAIAVRLGEEGVDVAINYVGRPEGAEATRDQIQHGVEMCMKQLSAVGTNPLLVEADVSDAAAVDRMFDQVLDAYGRGMQNLTRTLALEYASFGIRVNGIGPGATVTPINRSWIDDPVKRAAVEKHIPMRRADTSEEMAAMASFLCSDEAAYITGQTVFIDGGLTLFPSFETTWSSE
jgi:NAD(P)-dependent dehydrogenase (short-subunit alcohol dehydrogenase family)